MPVATQESRPQRDSLPHRAGGHHCRRIVAGSLSSFRKPRFSPAQRARCRSSSQAVRGPAERYGASSVFSVPRACTGSRGRPSARKVKAGARVRGGSADSPISRRSHQPGGDRRLSGRFSRPTPANHGIDSVAVPGVFNHRHSDSRKAKMKTDFSRPPGENVSLQVRTRKSGAIQMWTTPHRHRFIASPSKVEEADMSFESGCRTAAVESVVHYQFICIAMIFRVRPKLSPAPVYNAR